MLHRFRHPDLNVDGHDPVALRACLAYLRKQGHEISGLQDLLWRLESGERVPRGTIAFTVDDGYVDQASVAAPIFAEFDCPVTTFLATGFLDRTTWMWWDKMRYAFDRTERRAVRVQLGDRILEYAWTSAAECTVVRDDFTRVCKTTPWSQVEAALATLADDLDVIVPTEAPPEYAPMTWDDVRRCERGGMSFGPHTVTHPVLSRTDDARAVRELRESWRRVREEVATPLSVFCYPNGQLGDAGSREIDLLRREGMSAALLAVPGYVRAGATPGDDDWKYRVPRFAWPNEVFRVARITSGFERLNELLTGRGGSSHEFAERAGGRE
jgi:peptidoglycan/xylan/chitin deacetylase (PgdA/CDA1 family)